MDTKKENAVAVLLQLLLLVPATILSGWCLSVLWSWFIVATFGIQAITIAQAAGITVVVRVLTQPINLDKNELLTINKTIGNDFKWTIVKFMTLGIGYIITLFM